MVDTPRRLSTTAALLADSATQNISDQDIRDLMVASHFEALGYFNVKTFGAKGDGTDDSAAIQSAIDEMSNPASGLGGGTIFFPAGEYGIYSTLNVTKGQIRFVGVGVSPPPGHSDNKQWGTVLKWQGSSGQDMFYVRDSSFCRWEDMHLEGNSTGGKLPQSLIHFRKEIADTTGSNSGGWVISNCIFGAAHYSSETTNLGDGAGVWVGETDYGILVDGDASGNDGFAIQDCEFVGYVTAGFSSATTNSYATMTGCRFDASNSNWTGNESAIGVDAGADIDMFGVSFDGNGVDLNVKNTAGINTFMHESENSKKIADVGPSGRLAIRGGVFDLGNVAASSPFVESTGSTSSMIHIEDVRFTQAGTTDRTIRVKGGSGHSFVSLYHNLGEATAYDPAAMLDVDPVSSSDDRTVVVLDKDYNFYHKELSGNPITVT